MINPVNQTVRTTVANSTGKNKAKEIYEVTSEVTNENISGVTLEIGSKVTKSATYSNMKTVKPDLEEIDELQNQAEEALAPLRQMVEDLLKQQGLTFNRANGKESKENLIEITPEMRTEAQNLVGDGGEYSVENTSNRLVDYAKAISGGDKSKIDTLRDSIKKGFEEAQKAFGGELPQISKDTLDMTLKKLDEWENSQE
jgi:hypothetical protein